MNSYQSKNTASYFTILIISYITHYTIIDKTQTNSSFFLFTGLKECCESDPS